MFKLMWLMKRKDGTSMQDFIDYYENHHSRLGINVWRRTGVAPARYRRRYLNPFQDIPRSPTNAGLAEPPYDVAMEMWFDTREEFDRFIAAGVSPEVATMYLEDELKFLDPQKTAVFFIGEERETDLAAEMAERIAS